MKFANVSGGLRNILKSRNITYKDIADKLDMSESGVKKMLTSDDISFNKLTAILNILDMKIEDILGVERKTYAKLTGAQEAFLLKHPQHFNFFIQLSHYEYNLDDLKKENPKVSKAKTVSYIEDLKKISILEESNGTLYSTLQDGFQASSKFNEFFQTKSYSVLLTSLNSSVGKWPAWKFEGMGHFSLSQKSAIDYKMALKGLLDEFSQRSDREKKIYARKDLITTGSLLLNLPIRMKELFPI